MLLRLKRWAGHCLSIALYPFALMEMIYCSHSLSYANRFLSHKVCVRIYNLTRGMTESVEHYIFGPRKWRQISILESVDSISPDFASRGWSSLDLHLDTSDLCKQLASVLFNSRLSHVINSSVLAELPSMQPRGRWDAKSADLFALTSFANLVTNPAIHKLASALLGRYVITSASVWASFPCANADEQIASAQVFHVDQDYLDDLKLFVNLSDTGDGHGALEYLAGTNLPSAKKIWSSAPISEASINSLYPPDQHVFFTGPIGSAFISDNRGIHRDSPPEMTKSKLALQINFSRSQFGSEQAYAFTRPRLSPDWPSFVTWCTALTMHPFVYSLLFARIPSGRSTVDSSV